MLGQLSRVVDQAVAGRGHLLLLAGEAGIGKTTLLTEAARADGKHSLVAGAVRARAAHRLSRLTQTTANSRVVIHGPRQNGRSHCSGGSFAEIIAPSGSAMATLRPSGPWASEKIR